MATVHCLDIIDGARHVAIILHLIILMHIHTSVYENIN